MKAGKRVDVRATILKSRRVPCICPRQFENGATSRVQTVGISDSRGYIIERVECLNCNSAWDRINCR